MNLDSVSVSVSRVTMGDYWGSVDILPQVSTPVSVSVPEEHPTG